MWILDFNDYKQFLSAFMARLPKKGYGQSIALAKRLNVQQSVISAILKRDRHLTPEQGLETASFFGFDKATAKYFVLMIQHSRADSKALKVHLQEQLDEIRQKQMEIANAVPEEVREISEADKGVYYSNWYYSAARVALFIPKFRNIDALAEALELDRADTAKVLDFLINTKVIKNENGTLVPTSIGTSVTKSSEFSNNHLRNWRDKGRERLPFRRDDESFITLPMSISKEDQEWFHGEIRKLMEALVNRLETSKPEVMRCLNLDWFEV